MARKPTAPGLSRRDVLAGVAMSASVPRTAAAAGCRASPSLGAAAAARGLTFGCSIGVDVLGDPGYVDLVVQEARILTTDLAFKLPFVYPERGRFKFSDADRLVQFAARHKLPLRAHTLFWDLANPDWVAKLSVAERRSEFDRIIDTIVARFSGQIHSWDLVNEPFWPGFGEPGGFRRGAWYDALGKDYVFRAFQRAAVADPVGKLVLNCDMTERNDEVGQGVRRSVLTLVDELQAKGRRLGAVGLQGHVDPSLPFDAGAYEAFLWQLNERKVPIYITELDVLDTALSPDIARRDEEIARWYRDFLAIVVKIPNVEIVSTWQIADGRSWYRSDWYRSVTPSLPRGWLARPLPFDDKLGRKAAWHAMVAAFCAREPGRRASSPASPGASR